MFKVVNKNELPPKKAYPFRSRQYPDLAIGQGFEITQENFHNSLQIVRSSVHNAYASRRQKVKTHTTETGSLVVIRTE